MKGLAWVARWTSRRPETGADEWFRHTLVIPIPIGGRTDEDGDRHWPAVVLVTRPWWLCRHALAQDFRDYVRWHRKAWAAELAVLDDEEAWDLVHDGFARIRPSYPSNI